MFLLDRAFIIVLFISICFSQGPTNGYGIGSLQQWSSASAGGNSSLGMIPSYRSHISLSNPTTWSNLKFTFLSIAYNGFESTIKNNSKNGYSNLQSAQLIIPIKRKHALGIELHPYSYQKIDLLDSLNSDLIIFGDSVSLAKEYKQAGGIMAFNLSAASLILPKTSIGVTFQLLFGSSRQTNNLNIDEIPYTLSSRLNFSGINAFLFAEHKFNEINLYFKSKLSIKPLDALSTKLYPYFDENKNGYHDLVYDYLNPGYDFPEPNDVPSPSTKRLTDIHKPSSFGVGVSRIFLDRLQLSLELERNKDNSSFENEMPNSFNNRIINSDHFSLGLVWFPNEKSFQLFDNFTFRSGFSVNSYTLDEFNNFSLMRSDDKNNISEIGFSLGFGYKFKTVGNQIDFTYHSSLKDHSNSYVGEELFRGFQIGISIADIWFIKRRQR
ncbi:MAG: hypothetical protein P8O00_09875 [Candidatus Marinimicrobia bacterium]|nr:hypothetical protein [Candidatus Neomarinimicrobiota bacterium]